ncbi:bile acid:sodium symporter family protein [Pseudoalteromonas phenolica]|uniref:bile acid:sodium symporter family protein n=1 Tax=Pseudoalteromonas phenolica TaxID=161398 RepID=UPI00110B0A74|nr:bile acid:sodium symporter family protein [Pseudoalteromonas phenolica]TMO57207.1 bile acid:sodium symporter [Pseudoalteromonas phenolica]
MKLSLQLFPLWAVISSVIAYLNPSLFTGFKSSIVPLLMFIMLTMGLTLKPADFKRVVENKKAVGLGLVLQFTIMPVTAFLLSQLFALDTHMLIGMVLVGAVAGGTASNVLCYLAKGDVALSVTMTAVSTLAGVIMTPLLTSLLIGQNVDIPALSMLSSLAKIVLLPLLVGVTLNYVFANVIEKIHSKLPIIAMLAIIFIISIIVALNQQKLQSLSLLIVAAVVVHNLIGLTLGYWAPKKLGFNEQVCRTVAFEVGMQNSGLAVALAIKFFTPAAAIAGTLFSIWHNISGSLLAGYWQKKSAD